MIAIVIIASLYFSAGLLIAICVIGSNYVFTGQVDWTAFVMIYKWPVIYVPRKDTDGPKRRAEYRAKLAESDRAIERKQPR